MLCFILILLSVGPSFENEIDRTFIDLTWPVFTNATAWPNTKKFAFTREIGTDDLGYWYAIKEFCMGEHSGTHLDAPYHFYKHGWKVGDIPFDRLIANGMLVDLSEEVAINGTNSRLYPEHLDKWVEKNGPIPANTVLLVKFGWGKYYLNSSRYLGIHGTELCFPGFSEEATTWIIKHNIIGVGVDTASVDPGVSTSYNVHRKLSENQIYNLENVNLQKPLPPKGFTLFVMPMNLRDGTGAPLRLLAEILDKPRKKRFAPTTGYGGSNDVPIVGHIVVVLCCCILFIVYTVVPNA